MANGTTRPASSPAKGAVQNAVRWALSLGVSWLAVRGFEVPGAVVDALVVAIAFGISVPLAMLGKVLRDRGYSIPL